jgi:hypothetical protein
MNGIDSNNVGILQPAIISVKRIENKARIFIESDETVIALMGAEILRISEPMPSIL